MKKTTLLSLKCLFVLAFTQVNAQQIYTNGPLSTGATSNSGVAAPAGTTWSENQNEIGATFSNANAGLSGYYNTAGTTSFQLADDFTVPAGQVWNVTSFEFHAYQTGSAATPPPFDVLRAQIFNGVPGAVGTTSVAGDMTTNVLDVANTTDALMFRLFNSAVPAPGTTAGTTRRIWKVRANLSATLPAGTYWVVYQIHPTNNATAFFPVVTVPGVRTQVGWNARQNTVAAAAPAVLGWADILDAGNPATPPSVACDLPFNINGTVTLGVDENAFEASISLSPNPVKDILSITASTSTIINSYEIYDVNGKVVKKMNAANSSITEINVAELSVGNYILKLKSEQGIASKKFIKE